MDKWLGKNYYNLNAFLQNRFGTRVQRIPLDAGFNCPNRDGTYGTGGCTFCGEKGSGASYTDRRLSVKEQLLSGMEIIGKKYKTDKFIAYFQAFSNTYGPPEKLYRIYKEAADIPGIVGISIGTRPDLIDDEKLDILEELSVNAMVILEYGAQSMNDAVLSAINRGHNAAATEKAIILSKKRKGLQIIAHLIFGLPGELPAGMLNGARALSGLGIDGFKVNHLYIEKDSAMEKDYNAGKIKLLTREKYISLLVQLISETPDNVVFHRLFGECRAETLAAPLWTTRKNENIMFLDKLLKEKNITQGKNND